MTVVGVIADLLSKSLAFQSLAGAPVVVDRERVLAGEISSIVPPHQPTNVIPYVLDLQLVLNPGAVFGVGAGKRMFFVAFTLAAIAFGLWVFAKWTRASSRWSHVAIGLVLAGGVGNLYDRVTFACVRDFLHPLPGVHLPFGIAWPNGGTEVWPWVSNVADAFLLIGIAILLVTLWRAEPPPKSG